MKRLVLHFCALAAAALPPSAPAKEAVPTADPRQTVHYWRSYAVDPRERPDVAKAQQVFNTLLRGWDVARVPPELYVVTSGQGPWAASLADGNILLSTQAMSLCKQFGGEHWTDLLAFVLAHELAHQRANDLWHMQFFRLATTQTSSEQREMVKGLKMDGMQINDLERREAQADHDGLVSMTVAGFNPLTTVKGKGFFTAWVESIWHRSCAEVRSDKALDGACTKAKGRALLTKAKLENLALQSVLYQIGTQYFVAGDYAGAQRYFRSFGRDFPSGKIYNALGVAMLAEIYESMRSAEKPLLDGYYFPLTMEVDLQLQNTLRVAKRGPSIGDAENAEIRRKLEGAIENFERSLRVAPDQEAAYFYLGLCYLLQRNPFMAEGILRGKYLPKYGETPEARLLLTISSQISANSNAAEEPFLKMIDDKGWRYARFLSPRALRYALYRNQAAQWVRKGLPEKTAAAWRAWATDAQKEGDSLLFHQLLGHLPALETPRQSSAVPVFDDGPLGVNLKVRDDAHVVWFEGEPLNLMELRAGEWLVKNGKNTVINHWQEGGEGKLGRLNVGDAADRVYHIFGVPSRVVALNRVDYLVYDQAKFAVQISADRVDGWLSFPAATGD